MARNWLIVMSLIGLLAACTSGPITHTKTSVDPPPFGRPLEIPGQEPDFAWQRQGDRVFFDYDQSVLKPEGRDKLRNWVVFLNQYWNDKLIIEGHADERGTREYNLALGERRAIAVREFLVTQGIDRSRLSTISYGKERPAVLGSDEAVWAQNRRAVGVIR